MRSKVVIDIETLGQDLDNLDKISRDFINKQAKRQNYDKESTELKTSISPLTAEVIVIGMLNPDTQKGQIFYQNGGKSVESVENSGINYIAGSEKYILGKFWATVVHFDSIVTFNGRSFDIPFLITRSAIHKIQPSKNLLPSRYNSAPLHVDLLDQMTFYQPWRSLSTLHFFCKAFGIESPKEGEVTGYSIKEAYKAGRFKEIAKYNLQDLKATAELYQYWEKYFYA